MVSVAAPQLIPSLDTLIDMSGHVKGGVLPPDEQCLFDDFVGHIRRLGLSPERLTVEGISSRTLRRYLKGTVPTRLEDDTKLAMTRFLAGQQVEGYAIPGAVETNEGGGRNSRRELWRRLDAIDADAALTPNQKLIKREQELAAFRMGTQDEETRAAGVRARALDRETAIAAGRAVDLRGGLPYDIREATEDERRRYAVLRQMRLEEEEAARRAAEEKIAS